MKDKIIEYIQLTNQIFSRALEEIGRLKAAADDCRPSEELVARSRKVAADLVASGMVPASDEEVVANYIQKPEQALEVLDRVIKTAAVPKLGSPAGRTSSPSRPHVFGQRKSRSEAYDLFIDRLSALQ